MFSITEINGSKAFYWVCLKSQAGVEYITIFNSFTRITRFKARNYPLFVSQKLDLAHVWRTYKADSTNL